METISTINQALAWATHELRTTSETPRLDAELLLAHILGWARPRIIAEGRHALTSEQQGAFRELVARRAALEPVAYLIGHKEFYGLDFLVDQRVLVPRPETELLVDLTLTLAARYDDQHLRIADMGTGSGCVAITLAVHLPAAQVTAVDISARALEIARRNVERHGVAHRVTLLQGDLLEPLADPVQLIVSNPPYTILANIDEGVRRHEPWTALDGGADGLNVYRRLLSQAPTKILPHGALLLEIGATQGAAVIELAQQHFPEADVHLHQDLAGLDRVIVIDRQQTGR